MTSPPPEPSLAQPEPLSQELSRRHYEADCQFNAALARFQALGRTTPDLSLAAVARTAVPAFADGFCYLVRQEAHGLEVILRHSAGAEEVSRADSQALVSPALLLAGLLGIPVELDSQALEAESEDKVNAECAYSFDSQGVEEAQEPESTPEPEPAPAAEPDLMGPDSPAGLPGDHPTLRALTPGEIEAAVGMVKAMPQASRKLFTIAFRNAFNVPDTETRIATCITQVRHLQFIDRFTVEAAGGIGA